MIKMINKIDELSNTTFLESLLEQTQTTVVICDKNGVMTYVNKYAREQHEMPNSDVPYEEWSNFFTLLKSDAKTPIDKDDLPLFRLLRGESINDYEVCIKNEKKNILRYYLFNGSVIRDEHGEINGAFLVGADITAQKTLAQELKISVENYDKLLENAPNPILITKDGILLFANPQAATSLGFERYDEVIGKHLFDFIHPDDFHDVLQRMKLLEAGEKLDFVENKIVQADGSIRIVENSSIKVVYQGLEAILTVGRDVTERNRVREQLDKSRQQYQSLFAFHPDAVFMLDLEGTYVSTNAACYTLTGYTEDLVGKPFLPLLNPDDHQRVLMHFQKTIEGEPQNYECSIFHKKGHFITLNITNVPIVVDGETVGVYGIAKDLTEQIKMQEKIHHMAYYDSLTNLPNRLHLNERLKEVITESEQKGQLFAVLFIDLDRFKFVNDTMGHDVGDLLLKEVAKRLQLSTRDQDMVSRLGGDEFIILLNNVQKDEVSLIAHRVLDHFRTPLDLGSMGEVLISPSIGISIYPDDAKTIDAIIKFADMAMYMAKAKGRNNFQYYSNEMSQTLQRKVSIEKYLRDAIQNNEMDIHYQPIINLDSNILIGAEALLRWTNPKLGVISPLEFIPIAEEGELIHEIGEWILKEACKQAKRWVNEGHENFQIMVNLSIRQLQNRHFDRIVEQTLHEVGLEAKHLVLEITEGILHDPNDSVEILNRIRNKGVKIALDDFGTGYSSLSYLRHLPIDRLKIDRSFIQDLATNSNAYSMVKSIIDIGKNLDLRIVAEGIETQAQLDALKDLHCTKGQGYYISKPLTKEAFERTILIASKKD